MSSAATATVCQLIFTLSLAAGQPFWLQGDSIGIPCDSNQQCGEGGRCLDGVCGCLSTHVLVNSQKCLPKIKPGQSPCWTDEQCKAVWPDTVCRQTICQCTKGIHVMTRDGIVCIEYQKCPLGDKYSILQDESGNNVECKINTTTGEISGCGGQLHMYDCLGDKPNGKPFCCPTKGNTCRQPVDPGYASEEGVRSPRWHYDHMSTECRSFTYEGSGGNSNNFQSKEQCENYCKSTCKRGSPLYSVNDFTKRQTSIGSLSTYQQAIACDPSGSGCSNSDFQCDIIQPGRTLCCPSRAYICGLSGGVSELFGRTSNPYDEGVSCGPNSFPQQRWYYDANSRICSSFQYKGCGGNYNNFQTSENCNRLCVFEMQMSSQQRGFTSRPYAYLDRLDPNRLTNGNEFVPSQGQFSQDVNSNDVINAQMPWYLRHSVKQNNW